MDDENLPPSRQREILHQRKIAKPLMEKRRRERINNCLDQLKSLLTEVTKKEDDEEEENSYRSKLEKADILEMTVNYLKSVKRQKLMTGAISTSTDPASSIHSRYEAGFRECAQQVAKYLDKADGLSPTTRSTILHHLTRRLQQSTTTIHQKHTDYLSRTTSSSSSSSPQLLTAPPSAGAALGFVVQTPSFVSGSVNSASTSVVSHPIHLLPVKLATGETVFVLANPNDLLLRHQMLQILNEQPNTEGGGRRHTNEDTTSNHMQSVDGGGEKDGIVSYEAISPPAEATVSPLQLSRQNNHHTDALKPLSSSSSSSSSSSTSSTSSIDIYAKLQTTKYPPLLAKGDSATNGNSVFNNTASELAIESKFPIWLLSECSSSSVDRLSIRLPQGVIPEAQVVDHCQVSDDQSHVWRPW